MFLLLGYKSITKCFFVMVNIDTMFKMYNTFIESLIVELGLLFKIGICCGGTLFDV